MVGCNDVGLKNKQSMVFLKMLQHFVDKAYRDVDMLLQLPLMMMKIIKKSTLHYNIYSRRPLLVDAKMAI